MPVADWVAHMERADASDWAKSNENATLRAEIVAACARLGELAYRDRDERALAEMHLTLALIYAKDFESARIEHVGRETQPILRDIAASLERAMLNAELGLIDDRQVSDYPRTGTKYVTWLKKLISQHTSSVHSLYNDFIAKEATREDIAFYLAQETNLDPRFDDILALMQVGTEVGQKLEIAKNYFDEMGNGEPARVHSKMFSHALGSIGVDGEFVAENMLLDARISGNLSACLSLYRRHYFKAVGYFGVTEYIAPRRFKHVAEAWRRNRLPEAGIAYHDEHIVIDTHHANGWFNNVVAPLVDADPAIGREIAIGAVIRMNSSERYLDKLLSVLEARRRVPVAA
ncbi:iron-containing redox enzyme family protein [Paraburkholderia sp. 31.1]|nr:iron-containing redox enzyme family protein [Paraburkholderia sp. 31.1]